LAWRPWVYCRPRLGGSAGPIGGLTRTHTARYRDGARAQAGRPGWSEQESPAVGAAARGFRRRAKAAYRAAAAEGR
jgi:hypothetical protein